MKYLCLVNNNGKELKKIFKKSAGLDDDNRVSLKIFKIRPQIDKKQSIF